MTSQPWRRRVVLGDGQVTLYEGDCLEILPSLGAVDHVISDPPYGDAETHKSHLSTTKLRDGTPAGQALNFAGITQQRCVEMAREWCAIARRWVVFTCEWKYMHALHEDGTLVRFGIWRKPDGAPQFTGDRPGTGWEAVAICAASGRARGGARRKRWNGGGRHAFWEFPKGENRSGHPTGKPLGLYSAFVRDFTDPGETILDPFMGSGTTLVACAKLGRKGIGIELDPDYFQIACERVQKAYEQPDLFVEPPKQAVQEGFDL